MSITKKHLLVFTIDANYVPHLATALMSFIDCHSRDLQNFSIGLILRGISEQDAQGLVKFFGEKGLKIVCRHVERFLSDVKVGYHFNEVVFYRLLAPELFLDYERFLYLDSDILFSDSILDIFKLNLNSSALAAVEKTDLTGVPSYLTKHIDRYFASGLLLIDTEKFINQSVKEKCIHFLRNYYYEMPDQDALSFVVRDFVGVDPSYSVETAFLNQKEPKYDFAKHPKIIQFSGSSKPWHMHNNHPYKKIYWHYRNQTPYKSLFSDDFSLSNVASYILPNFSKRFLRNIRAKLNEKR